MTENLNIRQMTRPEVDELVAWAASEGWNPGLHDADIFWRTDQDAFISAELDGEVIGGGAITSYAGQFGFMGFFIVRPEFRGQGLGDRLWHARRDRLLARLEPGAGIGLDGVFEMQDYYARGGFSFSHRSIRYRAAAGASSDPDMNDSDQLVSLDKVPFDELAAYDRTCFPAPRPVFLNAWISQPEAHALGFVQHGRVKGYGVIRRCLDGCKIGPLFADDASVATSLYARLAAFADGGPVFLDVPENNPPALALVEQFRMEEVFGCARMYLGTVPDVAHQRVFGITTFELG